MEWQVSDLRFQIGLQILHALDGRLAIGGPNGDGISSAIRQWHEHQGRSSEGADESLFWLEVLLERETGDPALHKALLAEADQLTASFAASTITARATASRAREAPVADEPITDNPIRNLNLQSEMSTPAEVGAARL